MGCICVWTRGGTKLWSFRVWRFLYGCILGAKPVTMNGFLAPREGCETIALYGSMTDNQDLLANTSGERGQRRIHLSRTRGPEVC